MLAQNVGWPFIELDRKVEEEYGASVPDLIEMAGMATFRRQERGALERVVAEQDAAVITTPKLMLCCCAGRTQYGSKRGPTST
jgi:XRE family aerobic/anaerobic benzoate catabolism transcriptional regulator